jgi:LSD1 subclass zinc finger protein
VPIPDALRALRAARRQADANRAEADALFHRLGKPPGLLMRGWVAAADLLGTVITLLVLLVVWVGGLTALLSIFLLEFAAHWLAPTLHVDLVDAYGGFGLYLRFGLIVAVAVVLPLVLGSAFDDWARLRRELQGALAARVPDQAGGPSTCRSCGAPLDVPAGALGVTCVYCGADNLVGLPPSWVRRVVQEASKEHHTIQSAGAQEKKIRADTWGNLQALVILTVLGAPLLGLIGKIAVAMDDDKVPPLVSDFDRAPRHLLLGGKELPLGETVRLERDVGGVGFVALHHGEVLVVSSPDGQMEKMSLHSITTFPIGAWDEARPWGRTAKGDDAAWFRAPYTGVFRFEVSGRCARVGSPCGLRFSVADASPAEAGPYRPPPRREWKAQAKALETLAWSPDGRLLATGGLDSVATVWNVAAQREVQRLTGHKDVVRAVAFSPDGQQLATASADHSVIIWSVDGGSPLATLPHADRAEAVAWSSDMSMFATGSRDHDVRLWNARQGYALESTLKGHTDTVMSVAFTPDGKQLVSGGFDKNARLWDLATRRSTHTLQTVKTVFGLALVPGAPELAIATSYGGQLWSLAGEPEQVGVLPAGERTINGISASPDGQTLATADGDKKVRLWEAGTGRLKATLDPPGSEANALAFSPNGRALAVALEDGRLAIWELPAGRLKW